MGFLNSLIVRIKGDNADLKKTLADSNKQVSGFSSTIKKLGGFIAGAFAVGAIVNFTKEAINLAGQMQGVSAAFDKLNKPGLLDDLRKATRGTVTDLQLMQKAVQAKNFKIPLDQLATYFEFATKRAIQTGESVDYLVDSIITGIGRKSVLVMDNLGISAVELQKEVERVGDFGAAAGEIIRRELGSMGDVADTTATKIATIKTSLQNLKTELGSGVVQGSFLDKLLGLTNDALAGAREVVKKLSGRDNEFVGMSEEDLRTAQKVIKARKEQIELGGEAIAQELSRKGVVGWQKLSLKEDAAANVKNLKEVNKQLAQIENALSNITKITPAAAASSEAVAGATVKAVEKPFVNESADVKDPLKGDLGMSPLLGGLVNMNPAAIGTTFDSFTNEAVMQVGMMQDIISSAVLGAADVLTNAFGSLFEGIGAGNLDGVFDGILAGMAEFIISLGKMMIQYGIMLQLIGLASKIGPAAAPVLIGAGLAAVAIGSLIKGAVSKGPNLSGAGGGYSGGGGGYSGQRSYATSTQSIQLEGVLKGSDILISNRRTIAKQGGQT